MGSGVNIIMNYDNFTIQQFNAIYTSNCKIELHRYYKSRYQDQKNLNLNKFHVVI